MARITASELVNSLNNSSHLKELAAQHLQRVEESKAIRKIVNDDLLTAGVHGDFADFTNQLTPQEAFTTLAKHIALEDMPSLEMGILARCFAQPDAHEYWDLIKDKFLSKRHLSDSDHFKQGLAIALGLMCKTQEEIADLYELIEDSRNGNVRMLMMQKVKKANIPLFHNLFERLLEHDEGVRYELLSWKAYWKKHNPTLFEKWKNWKPLEIK